MDWILQTNVSVLTLMLVATVLCLRGKSAAIGYWLWMLALVRLLVPALPFDWWFAGPVSGPLTWGPAVLLDAFGPDASRPAEEGAGVWSWQLLPGFLLGLWIVGSAVMITRQLRSVRELRRMLRRAEPAQKDLLRATEQAAAQVGVAVPEVLMVRGLRSPILTGCLRPRLVWPRRESEAFDRPGVLIHEMAHLKRRDLQWAWLESGALVIWWWNPLTWFLVSRVRQYREMACDAWVGRILPEQLHSYSNALLSCAAGDQGSRPAPALAWVRPGARQLRQRLAMLYREDPARRRSGPWLGLAGLLFLLSTPGFVLSEEAEPIAPPGTEGSATTEPSNSTADAYAAALERFGVSSFEELEEVSLQAIEANPRDGRAHYRLGYALVGLGAFEDAIQSFLTQNELGFSPTIARYNLACCYAQMFENDQALDWLESAVESGFNDADYMEQDEDLLHLQEEPRFQAILEGLRATATP